MEIYGDLVFKWLIIQLLEELFRSYATNFFKIFKIVNNSKDWNHLKLAD